MKKTIIMAIATLTVISLIGGSVYAGDTFTVNSTEGNGKQGTQLRNAYVPFMNMCTVSSNGITGGNCTTHGKNSISAWIAGTFFDTTGEYVPQFDDTEGSGFTSQLQKSAFAVGQGLPSAWLTVLINTAPDSPLTTDAFDSGDLNRTEWVDQIVIKYSASSNFVQNFRSQISFGDSVDASNGQINRSATCATSVEKCLALIDQRLEQGDQRLESGNTIEDLRYAFQQAFAATSGINLTTDPDGGTSNATVNRGEETGMGQNIEQNMEGYFYSCLNCNGAAGPDSSHAFSPPVKLTYQTWPTRPKITSINHGKTADQTSFAGP
ncbi:MAG: hypothetical protein ACE5EA_09890 [Nitrospirota bacterium]